MRSRSWQSAVLGASLCGGAAAAAAPAPPAPPVADTIGPAIDAAWSALRSNGDFAAAEAAMQRQLDFVLARAGGDDREAFRRAALALRLARHLGTLETGQATALLDWLLGHEEVAAAVAFLIDPKEQPQAVYALLDRLRRERGDAVAAYPNLAAAICVVHDRPLLQRANENEARAADPVAIFDYYVSNERRMLFGMRTVPAELLVYVVDTTASLDEMRWAVDHYAGDTIVGARFFDVKYDTDHFLKGMPKKVTQAGWNLPNILRYGGVCIDQAYFAATVGKAIGVPTAIAAGSSSEVAHAWVGFLQNRGRQAWWNFDVGRYEEYQGVRGMVYNAQLHRRIPDSYVSLQAEMVGSTAAERQAAVAFADAAARLAESARAGQALPGGPGADPVRGTDPESILALLEQALRCNRACIGAWDGVAGMAGAMTLEQKKRWADVLHRLCGESYPDFYLAVLAPMIASVDEPFEQDRMWNQAFKLFGNRADLAAAVRMSQAAMWQQAGDPVRAGRCYEDVIARYANAGPFVVSALKGAERLLVDAGQGTRVLALYDRAFRSITPPRSMAGPFYRQSNFFRVGTLYAGWLEQAGRRRQAEAVRHQIGLS